MSSQLPGMLLLSGEPVIFLPTKVTLTSALKSLWCDFSSSCHRTTRPSSLTKTLEQGQGHPVLLFTEAWAALVLKLIAFQWLHFAHSPTFVATHFLPGCLVSVSVARLVMLAYPDSVLLANDSFVYESRMLIWPEDPRGCGICVCWGLSKRDFFTPVKGTEKSMWLGTGGIRAKAGTNATTLQCDT